MGIKGLPIVEVGYQEAVNMGLTYKTPGKSKRARTLFGGVKHLIGKMVSIDEDWVLKSKDWPYLWTKK